MMADELLNAQDLITAKKHDTFHSEVVTGKAGGLSTGANIDYATNAVTGHVQKTLPAIMRDNGVRNVGLFADGVTFTAINDVAYDADGNGWIYLGTYPFTATAGTVPSEPTYKQVDVKSLSNLTDRYSGLIDNVTITFDSVADMISGTPVPYVVGQKLKVQENDGHVSFYNVVNYDTGTQLAGGLWALSVSVSSDSVDKDGDSLSRFLDHLSFGDKFFRYAASNGDSKSQPIYLIGDSISEGTLSSDFSQNSYAALLRKSINKAFGHKNYGFANFNFEVTQAVSDPHTVIRAGFPNYAFNDNYFGGVMVESTGSGQYVEFTYVGKDCVVVYGEQVGGGTLDVTLDGSLVGTINTSIVPTQLVSGSSTNGRFSPQIIVDTWGKHTIRLTTQSASPVRLCGVCYYEDIASTLYLPTLFNVGRSSIALSDIPDEMLQAYVSSGTIILSLGVNDDLLSKPIETFKSKLYTIFNAVNAINGSILATDFIFSKPSTNEYKLALKEKCEEHSVPYFDFAELWFGDLTQNQYADLVSNDGVHPTDSGHKGIAKVLCNAIGIPLHTEKSEGSLSITVNSAQLQPISSYEIINSVISENTCQINGVLNNTGAEIPENTLLATLPVGHRPRKTLLQSISTQSGTAVVVEIRPNGGIYTAFGYSIPANNWLGINASFIRDTIAQ